MVGSEQTLSSVEIADMIEKSHSNLMRDIRRYTEQFTEAKIGFVDFFKESSYIDAKGETRPCYKVTKKGCEFIAHKLTGIKGTIFTARYINRFHEMENMILNQKPKAPWFIKRFRGEYIMLFRDFETITGVNQEVNFTSLKRPDALVGGRDYNGWASRAAVNKEEFRNMHGFDYGEDDYMMYLTILGIKKALLMYKGDRGKRTDWEKCKMIEKGLEVLRDKKLETKRLCVTKSENKDGTNHVFQIQVTGTLNHKVEIRQQGA